jgi:hypothetical protein
MMKSRLALVLPVLFASFFLAAPFVSYADMNSSNCHCKTCKHHHHKHSAAACKHHCADSKNKETCAGGCGDKCEGKKE